MYFEIGHTNRNKINKLKNKHFIFTNLISGVVIHNEEMEISGYNLEFIDHIKIEVGYLRVDSLGYSWVQVIVCGLYGKI